MSEKPKFRGPIPTGMIYDAKAANIPQEVFDVFNEFITKALSEGEAVVYQDDVVAEVAKRMNVTHETIFDNGWLDVEGAYRNRGWAVEYDKPGFNETYRASFTFRCGKR